MISSLGPVPLAVVWVLVALAVGAGVASVMREPAVAGVPHTRAWLVDMLLIGLLAGRLGFVLLHAAAYAQAPWSVLQIGDGGFLPWLAIGVGLAWGAWRVRALPSRRLPLLRATAAGLLCWLVLSAGSAWLQRARITLPALPLSTLDGAPATLAGQGGTPVVVNLWASWCGPCRREMPVLAQAQREHPQLRFVFVNQGETAEEVRHFLGAEGLSLHNVLLDEASFTAETLQVHAYPTTLFFDREGRLQQVHLGELTAPGLAAQLDRL